METSLRKFSRVLIVILIVGALPVSSQGIFDDKDKDKNKKQENKKKKDEDRDDDDEKKKNSGKSGKGESSSVRIKQEGGSYGYKTGIGLRGGFTSGLTLKHFLSGKSAVEGVIGSRWRGFSVTALYELHTTPALKVSRLAWEYGIGGRVGFYRGSYYRVWNDDVYYKERTYTVISVVGIFGLEYQFGKIPFTASVDLMPYFDFTYRGDSFVDGSLSFRYIF